MVRTPVCVCVCVCGVYICELEWLENWMHGQAAMRDLFHKLAGRMGVTQ